jgi:hypothetical protein
MRRRHCHKHQIATDYTLSEIGGDEDVPGRSGDYVAAGNVVMGRHDFRTGRAQFSESDDADLGVAEFVHVHGSCLRKAPSSYHMAEASEGKRAQ